MGRYTLTETHQTVHWKERILLYVNDTWVKLAAFKISSTTDFFLYFFQDDSPPAPASLNVFLEKERRLIRKGHSGGLWDRDLWAQTQMKWGKSGWSGQGTWSSSKRSVNVPAGWRPLGWQAGNRPHRAGVVCGVVASTVHVGCFTHTCRFCFKSNLQTLGREGLGPS